MNFTLPIAKKKILLLLRSICIDSYLCTTLTSNFRSQKTNLCDICYEYRNVVNPTKDQTQSFSKHVMSKNEN